MRKKHLIKQIERMKNCGNCGNAYKGLYPPERHPCITCSRNTCKSQLVKHFTDQWKDKC